jgi:putative oxidoreductase
MDEFVKFMVQFNFWAPELLAPLSVWWQFIGRDRLHPRPAHPLAGPHHRVQLHRRGLDGALAAGLSGWWPALILVFLGLLFATLGPGRYALDEQIARRARHDRDRTETAAAW